MNSFLLQHRLFNRYTLITAVSLFSVLILSWFFVSGLSEVLFMDYSAPDLGGRDHAEARGEMLPIFLQQIMSSETLINSSMTYVVLFLPLFYIFPTVTFSSELKSCFVFGVHRFKSSSKSLLLAIAQHSLIAALVSTATFILFYAIIGLFVTAHFDWMTMFGQFFHGDLYENNPLLFFIFMFCTIYFSFGFLFAFISCGLMLFIERPYFVIFGIAVAYYVYFYVGSYLDYFLSLLLGHHIELFWLGNTVTAFNTYQTTLQVFIPLIPIAIFAGILVFLGVQKRIKNVCT